MCSSMSPVISMCVCSVCRYHDARAIVYTYMDDLGCMCIYIYVYAHDNACGLGLISIRAMQLISIGQCSHCVCTVCVLCVRVRCVCLCE